jgi:hypothetical protein
MRTVLRAWFMKQINSYAHVRLNQFVFPIQFGKVGFWAWFFRLASDYYGNDGDLLLLSCSPYFRSEKETLCRIRCLFMPYVFKFRKLVRFIAQIRLFDFVVLFDEMWRHGKREEKNHVSS